MKQGWVWIAVVAVVLIVIVAVVRGRQATAAANAAPSQAPTTVAGNAPSTNDAIVAANDQQMQQWATVYDAISTIHNSGHMAASTTTPAPSDNTQLSAYV